MSKRAQEPTASPIDYAHFEGIPSPNGTIVPDVVLDWIMPDLTNAEFKVLMYIIRRTLGFKKDADAISIDQICNGLVTKEGRDTNGAVIKLPQRLDRGTGLGRSTALDAIRSLREKNLIVSREQFDPKYGQQPTLYALKMQGGASMKGDPVNRTPPMVHSAQGGSGGSEPGGPVDRTLGVGESGRGGSGGSDPQTTEDQQTEDQQTDLSKRERCPAHDGTPLDSSDSMVLSDDTITERPTVEPDPAPIVVAVARLSAEFGDDAPHASRTRVLNMRHPPGLDDTALLALLDEAAAITRSQAATITKRGRSGGIIRMPYLLATLRALVDTPDTHPPTAPIATEDEPAIPTPRTADAPDPDDPPATTEAAAVWRAVLTEMRRDGTRENYATWFAPTHARALEGDVLRVVVPMESHRRWLEHKLRRPVERALEHTGHAGVRVVYDVAPIGDSPPTGDHAADQVGVPIAPAPGATPPPSPASAAEADVASQAAIMCRPRPTVAGAALFPAVAWGGVP